MGIFTAKVILPTRCLDPAPFSIRKGAGLTSRYKFVTIALAIARSEATPPFLLTKMNLLLAKELSKN